MAKYVNQYWQKNGRKKRSFLCLIDNHQSKCLSAEKTLTKKFTKSYITKRLKKSSKKKNSKKKNKNPKTSKNKFPENEDLLRTNSSEEEIQPKQNLLVLENCPKTKQNIETSEEYTTDFQVFHYLYLEKNIDYKK